MMKKQDETAVSGVLARKPLFRALEQRIMFDAAAVDTVAQAAAPEVTINATDTQDDALLDNLAALVPPAERDRANLIVIDQGVENYDTLLQQIPDNYSVLVIPAGENGLARLAESLQNFNNLESIHILSHGSDNLFQLGADKLTAETVNQHADALATIGNALSAEGDLLLYGCNLSASDDGQSLLASIAALTGADVAASDDLTGAEALGGDWQLESRTGDIEAATLDLSYDGLLTGATYITTTAAGELDQQHDASDPIEFTINVDGDLPTTRAHLTIYAGDIDEEQGELDEVYLNGTLLGSLKGVDGKWSTTTFEISDLSLIKQGANDIVVKVDADNPNPENPIWKAQVDWGQLLIDGGSQEHGSLGDSALAAVSINETTATLTSQVTINVATSGTYILEAQLADQASGNIVDIAEYQFSGTASQTLQISINTRYNISAPDGVCVMGFNLFYLDGGDRILQGQTDFTFDTVQGEGPSTTPDSADNTVSFNGAGEYVFTVADFNFSDVDGDTLDAIVLKSLPSPGELTFNGSAVTSLISITQADIAAGKLRYTSAENGFGSGYSNFRFTVSDGTNQSSEYTLTFDVDEPIYIRLSSSALNQSDGQDHQVAVLTPFEQVEGASYTYSLTAGGINNDLFTVTGDKLIANDAGAVEQGTYSVRIQIVATGTVSYTRSQTFVITLTDDQAPTSLRDTNAAGDVSELAQGSVVEGAAADTEVGITVQADDTAAILYSLQTGASSDLFDIDQDSGVISVATGAAINFEANVLHSLTVVATDAFGNAATFTVNISVINGAPVLQNDAAEATERANNLTGNVLSNDTDPGSAAGSDLSVAAIVGPGEVGLATAGSDGGLFTVNANGSWSFNANGDFDELTDGETKTTQVTLDVRDSSGEGGTTQFEITVTGITAEAPDVVFSTTEIDQSLRRNSEAARLSIANPESGQRFTYSLVDGAGSDSNSLFTLQNGILRVVDDAANLALGELTIRVRTELVGDDPGGQYTIEQTYTLTVVDTVAPQFRGDSDRTGDGRDVNGRVVPGMTNDATVGITVEMDRADQGNVTFSLSSGGDRFQIDADTGVVSIKDAALISASDSLYTITVVATDLAGNNTSRDYNIQVNAVVGAAVDDTDRTTQGYERSGDVLRNDRDADGNNDALTVAQVNGSADNLNTAVAGSNGGLFTIAADGSWTFDPTDALNKIKQNESLDTAIEVSVRDSMGLLSTSTLTMTVLGRNDTPTNLQLSSLEHTLSAVNRVVGDLTVDDVDEGDTHTYRISRDNSRGFEVVGNQLLVKDGVSLTPGSYTLTLEASDSGRARALNEFTIVIADDGAPTFATPADSDSAGNDGETIQGAVNDGATEGTVGITASATDSSQITYSLEDDASGRFVIDDTSGVISVKQGATILLGDAFYDVTVRATDAYDNRADQVFRIAVKDVPPVAVDDTEVTVEDNTSPVTGQVLSNDDNPGETPEQLSVSAVNGSADNLNTAIAGSQGGQFTVQADGTWSFTPDAAFNEMQVGDRLETSVTVTISDSRGSTSESRLTVTVNGENDVPTAILLTGNSVALDSDNLVLGDLSATDSDTGDSHSFTLVEKESDAADNRFFRINGTQLELVDTAIGAGTKTVHIQVSDANGLTYIQTLTLRVTDTAVLTITGDSDTTRDATDGSYNGLVKEGAAAGSSVGIQVQIDYLLNDNPTVNFSLLDSADNRFVIDQHGVISVAENAVFDVTVTSTYTVIVQAQVGVDIVTSSFVVGVVPAALGLADDTAEVSEDAASVGGNVLDNDPSNAQPGGPLTVLAINDQSGDLGQSVAGDNGGNFTVNANGSWQFDPAGAFDDLAVNETRMTTVTITVRNTLGDTASSTLTVTVTGQPDAPTDLQLDNLNFDVRTTPPVVGVLSGTDVDSEQADLTFSLPVRPENPDNALFDTAGNQLRVRNGVVLEVGVVYNLYIEVSDGSGSVGRTFAVTAMDPTVPYVTGDADTAGDNQDKTVQGSVDEGRYNSATAVGITVESTFGGDLTYSLHDTDSPADTHDLFTIDASSGVISVKDGAVLNAESATRHTVLVKATDTTDANNSTTRIFTVEVNNLAPTVVDDNQNISNQATVVTGNIRSNDSDPGSAGGTHNLTTLQVNDIAYSGAPVAGSAGGEFVLGTDGSWTFRLGDDFQNLQPGESVSTSIRILSQDVGPFNNPTFVPTDAVESTLTVVVTAPGDIGLDNNRLDLAQPDSNVGDLSSVAAGPGPFTFELVSGDGDGDNALFRIDGSALVVEREPMPAAGEYNIRVRMSSSDGPVEAMFTIVLLNTTLSFDLVDIDSRPGSDVRHEGTPSGFGTVTEGVAAGSEVGIRVQPDQPTDVITYALTDTSDGRFTIHAESGVVTVDDASRINAEDGTFSYLIRGTATEQGSGRVEQFAFTIYLDNAPLQASNDQATILANATTAISGNVFTNDSDANSNLPGSDVAVLGAGSTFDSYKGQNGIDYTDLIPQMGNGLGQTVAGSDGGVFRINADGSWTFEHNGDFNDLAVDATRETRITVLVSDIGLGWGADSIIQGDLPDFLNGKKPGTPVATEIVVTVTGTLNTQDFQLVDTDPAHNGRGMNPHGYGAVSEGAANGTLVGITVGATESRQTLTFAMTDDADGRFDIDTSSGEISVKNGELLNAEDGSNHYQVRVTATEAGTGLVSTDTFIIFLDNATLNAADDYGQQNADATTPISGNVFSNDRDANSTLPGDDVVVWAAGTSVESISSSPELTLADASSIGGDGIGQPVVGSSGGLFRIDHNGNWTFEHNGDFDDLAVGVTRETRISVLVSDQGLEWGEDSIIADTMPDFVNDKPGQPVVSEIIVTVVGIDNTVTFELNDIDDTHNSRGMNPNGYGAVNENAADDSSVGITVAPTTTRQTLTFELTNSADGRFSIDGNGVIRVVDGSRINAESGVDHYNVVVVARETATGQTGIQTFTIFVDNTPLNALDDAGQTTENATSPISGNVFSNDSDPNSVLPGNDVVVLAAGPNVDSLRGQSGLSIIGISDHIGQGLNTTVAGSNGGIFRITPEGNWQFETNGDFAALDQGETTTSSLTVVSSDHGMVWGEDFIVGEDLPAFVNGKPGTPVVTEIVVTIVGENAAPVVTPPAPTPPAPTPVDPTPTDPTPTDPTPTDPTPTDPTPTDPTPTDPTPTDPTPTDPTPTDPTPTDPTPTDPTPTDPTPTDPTPTDPTPTDPTPTDPAPTDPAPTDPAPTDPAPTDPTPPVPPRDNVDRQPVAPAGQERTPADPGTPELPGAGDDPIRPVDQPLPDLALDLGNDAPDNTPAAPAPANGEQPFDPNPFGPTAAGGERDTTAPRGTERALLPDGQFIEVLPRNANLTDYTLDIGLNLDDQLGLVNTRFSYEVPAAAFVFTSGGESFVGELSLRAVQVDGSPLPAWLSFDDEGAVFSGVPGENDEAVIEIRVIAESADGQKASAVFQIKVSDQSGENPQASAPENTEQAGEELASEQTVDMEIVAGKAGLSDQLAQHAALETTAAEQQLLKQLAQFNFDQTPAS